MEIHNKRATLQTYALLLLAFVVGACSSTRRAGEERQQRSQPQGEAALTSVDREFRAAWVATVANIDWPSKPGLSTQDQMGEARAILDTVRALGLNAVILQVRPHCDAMYASRIEPWSYYLTGTEGRPPDPWYDPLAFWIEEAHDRGIELHAWFNPYRAHLKRGGDINDSSIVRKYPGIAKLLPDSTYWLDPAKQQTQDHSYNVVMDVIRRYDIDGVHFDDYFYPYGDAAFPDNDTWEEYTKSGGSLSRDDWRRAAVNAFIERVYQGVKREKPHVKFGLSPFGIWRPSFPPSISGFDQFSRLYADARLWLNKGWIDYWSPQLYWPINQIPQSFPVLLGWWVGENVMGRHLWPGMYTSTMRDEKGVDENINQIMVTRGFVPEAPGHIHFSMKSFMRDSSLLNPGLKAGPYQRQALIPSTPWLDDSPPSPPTLKTGIVHDTITISWVHASPADVFRWVVYTRYDSTWSYSIVNRRDRMVVLPLTRTAMAFSRNRQRPEDTQTTTEHLVECAISAVDRMGNESEPVAYRLTSAR